MLIVRQNILARMDLQVKFPILQTEVILTLILPVKEVYLFVTGMMRMLVNQPSLFMPFVCQAVMVVTMIFPVMAINLLDLFLWEEKPSSKIYLGQQP